MGIQYLQYFMRKKVPNGVNNIDIKEEVNKYKEQYGKEPTIIIHLRALYNETFVKNNHETMIGERFNIYNDRITDMFQCIKDLGVKIIFFQKGLKPDFKLSKRLERRIKRYNYGVDILHAIDKGIDISQEDPDLNVIKFSLLFPNLITIASKFGDVIMSTHSSFDLELAKLATKMDTFAIMSHDTNFLIFEGDWHYWSCKDFDLTNITTLEYNRKALRDFLRLSSNQLALCATLAGNNVVRHDALTNFHRKFSLNTYTNFTEIADFVRGLRSTPPEISEMDMDYLVKSIFTSEESKTGYDLIRSSLNSYNYNTINTTHGDDFLDKIFKFSVGRDNYYIMANIPLVITVYYFDLSNTEFMSFYDLVMQLIRPQMGILLKHLNNPNVSRVFYGKKTHEEQYQQYVETPIYPEINVPPIDDLLLTPIGNDENLDKIRWNLLCWQISSKLNPDIIKPVPKDNLITVLTIFYLFERKQISTDEADCLILANNCPDEIRGVLEFDAVKTINGRDARITFLFSRVHGFIASCFKAVGLGNCCLLITFDGLYFHILRKKWRTEYTESEKMSHLLPYKKLRLYSDEHKLL